MYLVIRTECKESEVDAFIKLSKMRQGNQLFETNKINCSLLEKWLNLLNTSSLQRILHSLRDLIVVRSPVN